MIAYKLEKIFNLLELLGVIVILALALILQYIYHELPCPLCLLQRIGFFGIIFGLLLNLRFGFRPSHYAIVLMSGIFTSAVSLRQIALHIIPGTGSYGTPLFGLHLYTWSFIFAVIIIIVTTLLLGIDRQYQEGYLDTNRSWNFLTHSMFFLVSIIMVINLISIFLECGLKQCPDNPVNYEVLSQSN